MKKVLSFITSASQSRTAAVLGLLIVLAAIPLTVLVAQRQQEIRQQAAGETLELQASVLRSGGEWVVETDTLNLQPGEAAIILTGRIRGTNFASANCTASSEPVNSNWNGPKPVITNDAGGEVNEGVAVFQTATFRLDCVGFSGFALNDSVKVVVPSGGGVQPPPGGGTQPPPGSESCSTTGQLRCSGQKIQICGEDGSGRYWRAPTDCPSGLVCTGSGECKPAPTTAPPTPQCNEGTDNLRCSGSQVQQCQDGIWKLLTDCPSFGQICKGTPPNAVGCSPATTAPPPGNCASGQACSTAEYLQYRCTNNGWQLCSQETAAGNQYCWSTPAACTGNFCQSVCPGFTPTTPPTPTTSPGVRVNINYAIGLDGIGSTGDRVNPSNNSLSNKAPQRTATASILYVSGEPLANPAERQATLHYDSSSGKYIGNVTNFLWSSTPGTFVIKIGVLGHLVKTVFPSISVSDGQTIDISADLVAGDINNDNQLSVLDYNMLVSCFGIIQNNTPLTCREADLNEDGTIDQVDYNLFLREMSVIRQGD